MNETVVWLWISNRFSSNRQYAIHRLLAGTLQLSTETLKYRDSENYPISVNIPIRVCFSNDICVRPFYREIRSLKLKFRIYNVWIQADFLAAPLPGIFFNQDARVSWNGKRGLQNGYSRVRLLKNSYNLKNLESVNNLW